MVRSFKVKWLDEPKANNYPAAESYLRLFFEPAAAAGFVKKLRKAKVDRYVAKDLLRACGTPPGIANVEEETQEILAGKKQSPILLVRDPVHGRLVVADGFHRLCAVFELDQKALIPCKLV
jgi:hypothetical protein